MQKFKLLLISLFVILLSSSFKKPTKRYLYVVEPGIRNYLEYGGHGILVYDIDNDFKLIKRIKTGSYDKKGHPLNVKGVCVSLAHQCIYVSTIQSLMCISLTTDELLWEKVLPNGCDRMSITPDGLTIFQPSFEKENWYVLDAKTGDIKKEIVLNNRAHNTLISPDGKEVFCEGLNSPFVTVLDAKTYETKRQIGPFAASVRPFTISQKKQLLYANVNDLLGFEIGDLKTGKVLHSITVPNVKKGEVKRHACPSHGVGLTPNEKEVWVVDASNQKVHIFDNTQLPPVWVADVPVRDQPGWVTFSIDGKWAFPSTGEMINTKTRKIKHSLSDEEGRIVQSEKVIEIHFEGNKATKIGDQFGIGRLK
jgi:DNA-binding beta-propeller fold protein YncE